MSTIIVVVVTALALLAIATQLGVSLVERAHPPRGRFVEVKNARLHVVDVGPHVPGEPAIVLVHGASSNLESVRQPLGDRLARRHRVIMIDRPGHGWSTRAKLTDSTPETQARMIDEALEKLGIKSAIIVGHSWGGAVLPALALQNPSRAAGLVMLAPVTHPWKTGVAWYHTLAAIPLLGPFFAYTLEMPVALAMLQPGARGAFLPQSMPEHCVRDTALPLLTRPREFLTNGHDMVTLEQSVAALQPRYGEIKIPAIVIHGDADTIVSIDIHARQFVREVKSARLVELPGVGHMVQNAAPDVVTRAIEELVSAVQPIAAE